jgi:hypothetical protein
MKVSWRGHPVANEKDAQDLEAVAAHRASLGSQDLDGGSHIYNQYRKQTHEKAAAHHMCAAQELDHSGQKEAADRHRIMFKMHLGAAGHNPRHGIPDAVKAHVIATPRRKLSFYESHPGDALLGD